jgi:hypothetical protein
LSAKTKRIAKAKPVRRMLGPAHRSGDPTLSNADI